MIDELEGKGPELSLDDQQNHRYQFWIKFEKDLMVIFECLGVPMPKCITSIIGLFLNGVTFVLTDDGGEFLVNTKALRLSSRLNIQAESNPRKIRVNKISRDTFRLMGAYLNHHNGVEPAEIQTPISSLRMSKIVEDQWDAAFANSLSKKQAFQLLHGSQDVECRNLTWLLTATVTTLAGKSAKAYKLIRSLEGDDETDQNNERQQAWPDPLILEDEGEDDARRRKRRRLKL